MKNVLQFEADTLGEDRPILRFELQPIIRLSTMKMERYEALYRGLGMYTWQAIDEAFIRYLGRSPAGLPPLFVNVCNEALLTLDDAKFTSATEHNDVIFELSEASSGYAVRKDIAAKANRLISSGVRFALDDFGAGRDGLDRFFSLTGVSYVKIDADFILTCMHRCNAADILRCLLGQWKADGIISVAEGIETAVLFDYVNGIGVEMAQGWYVDSLASTHSRDTQLLSC